MPVPSSEHPTQSSFPQDNATDVFVGLVLAAARRRSALSDGRVGRCGSAMWATARIVWWALLRARPAPTLVRPPLPPPSLSALCPVSLLTMALVSRDYHASAWWASVWTAKLALLRATPAPTPAPAPSASARTARSALRVRVLCCSCGLLSLFSSSARAALHGPLSACRSHHGNVYALSISSLSLSSALSDFPLPRSRSSSLALSGLLSLFLSLSRARRRKARHALSSHARVCVRRSLRAVHGQVQVRGRRVHRLRRRDRPVSPG
eukprot:1866425-Rhodomonas_salina.1